jgi:hypothetical protein
MRNANLIQRFNFIDVFSDLHVSGAYAYHHEHYILSCSIWFSAPSLWMGGGLESCCVGRVYGADGAHNTPDVGRLRPKHLELRIHQ